MNSPLTLARLLRLTVQPVLTWLDDDFAIASDTRAAVLLLAIAGQECGLADRCQVSAGGVRGPAHGLWQFERAGGVMGVLRHPQSRAIAEAVCAALLVKPEPDAVWQAIEHNDTLACAFARLLLWTDPKALPGDAEGGWALYSRTWRPGRPHPETWSRRWADAQAAIA
jgi:hypothetical protein